MIMRKSKVKITLSFTTNYPLPFQESSTSDRKFQCPPRLHTAQSFFHHKRDYAELSRISYEQSVPSFKKRTPTLQMALEILMILILFSNTQFLLPDLSKSLIIICMFSPPLLGLEAISSKTKCYYLFLYDQRHRMVSPCSLYTCTSKVKL